MRLLYFAVFILTWTVLEPGKFVNLGVQKSSESQQLWPLDSGNRTENSSGNIELGIRDSSKNSQFGTQDSFLDANNGSEDGTLGIKDALLDTDNRG